MSEEPERLSQAEILEKLSRLNQELLTLSRQLGKKNRELKAARDKIKVLEGKIPICGHCKSMRGEKEQWRDLESFLTEKTNVWFTHTICPDCMSKRYGFMDQR